MVCEHTLHQVGSGDVDSLPGDEQSQQLPQVARRGNTLRKAVSPVVRELRPTFGEKLPYGLAEEQGVVQYCGTKRCSDVTSSERHLEIDLMLGKPQVSGVLVKRPVLVGMKPDQDIDCARQLLGGLLKPPRTASGPSPLR